MAPENIPDPNWLAGFVEPLPLVEGEGNFDVRIAQQLTRRQNWAPSTIKI